MPIPATCRIARRLHGQLTATLVAEPDDAIVGPLTTILTRKAGRILWEPVADRGVGDLRPAARRPVPGQHHTRHHLGRNRRIEPFRAGGGMAGIPAATVTGRTARRPVGTCAAPRERRARPGHLR